MAIIPSHRPARLPSAQVYQPQPVIVNRPSAAKRGYDGQWKKKRADHLRNHPWCVDCAKHGLQALATDVDHNIPLAAGGADHESNYVSRCHSCHSRKTAKRDGGFGRKRKKT